MVGDNGAETGRTPDIADSGTIVDAVGARSSECDASAASAGCGGFETAGRTSVGASSRFVTHSVGVRYAAIGNDRTDGRRADAGCVARRVVSEVKYG